MTAAIAAVGVLGVAAGCASSAPLDALPPARSTARPRPLASDSRALALVNGRPVSLGQLAPTLLEVAGRSALDELVLDAALHDEAARQGVSVNADDIERERSLFLESLSDAGVTARDGDARSLLLAVRRRRGLGPERFAAMLQRSALLRKLVKPSITVTDEMVKLVFKIDHGQRRDGRLITTATLADAQRALDAINAGMPFIEAAARFSTDASAARGGVIEPISPADPDYPASIRRTLASLAPGQVSSPVAIDSGFAILRLERVIPGDGASLEDLRTVLRRSARLRQERLKMSELASRLVRRAAVTILDPSLRFSSESR